MSEKKDKVENIIKDICSLLENEIQKDIDLSEKSFEPINTLYSKIYEKFDEIEQNKEKNYKFDFAKNYEELKKNQIEQINNSIKEKEPEYIYMIKLLNSQIIIYNFLTEEFLEKYLNVKEKELYNIMKTITTNIISDYNKLENITVKLIDNFEVMNEEINNLNMELGKKDKYLRQLNDKNILLQEKLSKNNQDNQIISIKLFNNKANNEIIEPYNDNAKYKMKNYSKIMPRTRQFNLSDNAQYKNKLMKERNNFCKNMGNNAIKNINIDNILVSGNRIFTIKVLKDLIYNIYSSKTIFNNKCIENRQPKETMEEYLYTYLNYKYGLNNMVIEWATNIINGIKNYSNIDSEVCLFGKILRNDLDESCQYIMPKIKKNLEVNMIKILKKEYPLKRVEEIIEYKNKLMKNRLPLNLLQLVLNNIYNKNEQAKILPKIIENINEYKNQLANNENNDNNKILYDFNCINKKDNPYHNKLSRIELDRKLLEKENESSSIAFSELVNILHEFEVEHKEKKMKTFVEKFKDSDDDKDGILNENQFFNFVKELNVFDENQFENSLNELLNLIDPYGYKKIIFSDCMEIFSTYSFGNKNIIDIINKNKNE